MRIIYYGEVNMICIILLMLYGNLFFRKLKQQSSVSIIFNHIILMTILFCLSDMIAGIFRGSLFPGARIIITLSNWIYYEALVIIDCLWLIYVLLRLSQKALSKKKLFLISIPMLFYTIIALLNFYNGFMFTINEQNLYVRGQGVIFHWIITWGYLLVSTIITINAYIKEKSKIKKQEIKPLMYFIIAPTIASIIQMMYYGVTSAQVGITISIIMVCISNQNSQILTDPLTGLNNRRGLDNYLDNYLNHNNQNPMTLMMIDINGFKKFNDTYGHVAGDRALIQIAQVLKNNCKGTTSHLFICRYGGDEFVIAGFFDNDEKKNELKQAIYDSCTQLEKQGQLPCSLNVSIGYASGICQNNKEVKTLLSQADTIMYKEKDYQKQIQ